MSYFIIKNFITKNDCKKLLLDVSKIPVENFTKTHAFKRFVLSSSNENFKKLLLKSKNWQKLSKKLSSKNFFEENKKKLSIENNFYVTSFFSNYSLNDKNHLSYKRLGLNQLNNVNLWSLLKYIIYRAFRSIKKIIKFNLIYLIKSQPIELIYDYSKATNGYENKVHRDSDQRIIIFLLYLNKMEPNSKGGNFQIYKNITNTKSHLPNKKDRKLIKNIKPTPGKLIVMLNNYDHFHATDKILNLNKTRDFIYGAYTILAGSNPFLDKKNSRTGFHVYD